MTTKTVYATRLSDEEVAEQTKDKWLFTQNSTSCSACPHEQILLVNDEEPTLCCRSCGKRWTFVPAGELPRYCSEEDPKYPGMLDNRGWSKSTRVTMVDDQDHGAAGAPRIQRGEP